MFRNVSFRQTKSGILSSCRSLVVSSVQWDMNPCTFRCKTSTTSAVRVGRVMVLPVAFCCLVSFFCNLLSFAFSERGPRFLCMLGPGFAASPSVLVGSGLWAAGSHHHRKRRVRSSTSKSCLLFRLGQKLLPVPPPLPEPKPLPVLVFRAPLPKSKPGPPPKPKPKPPPKPKQEPEPRPPPEQKPPLPLSKP